MFGNKLKLPGDHFTRGGVIANQSPFMRFLR